ncbi:MAG TPA: PilX N-terminal domain-containing pilus assembly protein [Steroidobacteraceae bacterium]|nr:PilX N-terminal domain-containing pilus assembly protein [Steroidobacteraceae bacterium]
MKRFSGHALRTKQHGAALVVGLILLLVLTLLAITGMGTAVTELVMAGNEQYRENASQNATAGIEAAIPTVGTVPPTEDAAVAAGPVPVPGTDRPDQETYSTKIAYVGEENDLPQSSAGKFIGLHYVIESTGQSARNASDTQQQGLLVITPSGNVNTEMGKVGAGLGN